MIIRSDNVAQAPGTLSAPGGKVEHGNDTDDVLEQALRRELLEETGVTVGCMHYICSSSFTLDSGEPVVDVAFLCKFESGQARVADPLEVAGVDWLTFREIEAHDRTQPWTRTTARAADILRRELGW